MGIITRRQSGLIFSESFDSMQLDPRLEIAPYDTNRWSLEEPARVLRLKHGATPIYAFLNDLTATKQFVLDIKNDYNPTTFGDVGGIIVYGSDSDYITLDEYFNASQGTTHTYRWLRLVRDYNTYYGYWSDDGVAWHAIGSQEFDNQSPRIGLFLLGEAGQDLVIEEVRATAGTDLIVENVKPGQQIDLLDGAGNVLDSKIGRDNTSRVSFPLGMYQSPLPARVSVAGTAGVSPETSYSFWGGDVFAINYAVDLFFIDDDGNSVPLEDNIEAFLGYLSIGIDDEKAVKMVARNIFTTGVFSSVLVTTADYNGTGQFSRVVSLAADDSGMPGTHQPTLNLPAIPAGGEQAFWVLLTRETDPARLMSEISFGLTVTAAFN